MTTFYLKVEGGENFDEFGPYSAISRNAFREE